MENVRKISKKYYLREIVACFLVTCLFFNAPVALAEVVITSNPVGTITVDPVVPAVGDYDFTQAMSASDGAIGNFSNFDIESDLFVTCTQPGANANALFKVFSGDGTQILGRFDATGNVYLYDGAGIFVGSSGIVNANSFIASSLDIDNTDWQDFVGGTIDKLKFGPLGVEDLRSAVENQGTITAPAGVYLVGPQVLNSGTINSGLVVMAAGEKVYLKHGIDSKVYIETPSDLETPDVAFNKVDNTGTISTDAKVLLAAGDIFSGAMDVASLAATANRDITLTAAVETEGDMELVADFDGSGGATGGTMWAQSTLISTAGSIDISASDNTIDLDDDVTADVDLVLNNNTTAADGIALTAGQNVDIATGKILTAEGSLAIEATAGEIMADTSIIDMAADGETLALTQNASLHLTANFNIGNRDDTDLVANSTGGAVTSTQADIWNTIDATADTFIDLDDSSSGGSITTNSLTAGGDIDVISNHGDVTAQSTVSAGGNIAITADDNIDLQAAATAGGNITLIADTGGSGIGDVDAEALTAGGTVDISASDTTINLHDNVTAGVDILLNNDTVADAGITLDAGQDVILADSKTMNGNGTLTVEADRDITLGGAVSAAGNLNLSADDDGIDGGDVWAKSSLTAGNNLLVRGDNIQVDETSTSKAGMLMVATGNITLGDAALAGGGMGLHADGDVWAKSSLASSGDMVVRGENIKVDSFAATASGMLMVADDDITLGSATSAGGGMGLYADDDGVDGGDVWAQSSLTTSSGNMVVRGDNIQVEGIASSGAGMLMVAAGNITLGDAATSAGGMGLHADDDGVDGGNVLAQSSLTSGGNMAVSGKNIQVDGTATSGAGMLMVAADNITLGGAASATGGMGLHADDDGVDGGNVLAQSSLTSGGNMAVSGKNIQVDGTTSSGANISMVAADNIVLNDAASAIDNITLVADDDGINGGDVDAQALTAGGTIDISASDTTINLHDNVTAGVDILLNNNTVADNGIKLDAGQDVIVGDGNPDGTTLTGEGALTVEADRHITLGGAVVASDTVAGNLILKANAGSLDGDMTAYGTITNTANGGGSIDIYSSDTTTYLWDNVTAAGDLIMHNDTEVKAADKTLQSTGDDVVLAGGKTLDSDYDLTILAADDIILGITDTATTETTQATGTAGNVSADGHMLLDAGDDVYAHGTLTTTSGGDITINSSDDTTYLYGDYINASGSVLLNNTTESYGDIIASENVTLNGTVELKGTGLDEDQEITATNGKLIANDWVHKTSAGDLDMFGGFDGPLGSGDYSVSTKEVRVEEGELYITGNAFVLLDGDIYSSGRMELTSNADGVQIGVDAGTLEHASGTIVSRDDDVDMAARNSRILLNGGVPFDPMDPVATTYVSAGGDILLYSSASVAPDRKLYAGDDVVLAADKRIVSSGSLNIEAGEDIMLGVDDVTNHWVNPWEGSGGNVSTAGDLTLDAGRDIYAHGTLTTTNGGDMLIEAGDNIDLFDAATSNGSMTLYAGTSIETMALTTNNGLNGDIDVHSVDFFTNIYGPVTSAGNLDVRSDNDDVELYDYIDVAGNATIFAGGHIELATDTGAKSTIGGYLDATANREIEIYGEVETGGDLTLTGDYDDDGEGYVWVEKNLTAGGDIEISSSDWTTYLMGDYIHADGSVFLNNNTVLQGEGSQTIEAGNGTLDADGWVWKITPGHLYLLGNVGDSEYTDAISLNNNRDSECPMLACLPAASTALGNLEIYAENGDIQISGDLTTFGAFCYPQPEEFSEVENGDYDSFGLCGWYDRPTGGVSVIADNGKIYTEGASPDNDTLNIGIVGNSDQLEGLGVDLPYSAEDDYEDSIENGDGDYEPTSNKAAIVVMSSEDLKFGPDTQLIAKGTYDSSVVDDRPAINFLDEPATIGGILRDEGDPIDVAVYLASTEGDVHLDGRAIDVEAGGTMVVDAYDTVTFGDFDTFDMSTFEGCADTLCFLIKLALRFHEDIDFEDLCISFQDYADGYDGEKLLEDFFNDYFDEGAFFNIDRMEVSSRVTEWLFQAVSNGTLPFAGDAAAIAAFEDFIGGEYVLRGAGLGNPAITDGRAWVLEDPILPPPLYTEAGERAEEQEFGEGGCPALMNWLAGELGIEEDQIEVTVANAFASSTDIQPCEMCARLRDAATILEDAEGAGVASLVQVVNEFVATPAPPSEEQMASIATAFADHTDDGTYYAAAGQWIDALVEYVGILTFEMGYSAEESTGYANKYMEPVTDTGNAGLIAYVQARLAALGG